jgi:hypothetical protein
MCWTWCDTPVVFSVIHVRIRDPPACYASQTSSFRPDTTFGFSKDSGNFLDHKFENSHHTESNSGRISELATAGAKTIHFTFLSVRIQAGSQSWRLQVPDGAGRASLPTLLRPCSAT